METEKGEGEREGAVDGDFKGADGGEGTRRGEMNFANGEGMGREESELRAKERKKRMWDSDVLLS